MLKQGDHSELIIERPDGLDRCSLLLISYDTPGSFEGEPECHIRTDIEVIIKE